MFLVIKISLFNLINIGNLLDDIDLIKMLHETKQKAIQVKEELKSLLVTKQRCFFCI